MSIKHIINDIKTHFNDKPIKVAELGILRGEGIPVFLNHLNIKEYHGVDAFINYEENKDGSYDLMKNHGEIIYTRLNEIYKQENRVHIHKGFTTDIVNKFDDNYFDLIFIDAGHNYPQVSEDIKLWYPKMKTEGIFSGDDYYHPPVQKAVGEFANKHNLKLYNSNGQNQSARCYGNDHILYWSWYFKT